MMTRRAFIQTSATASAAFVVPHMIQQPSRYKMGLQLYTMRAAMAQDLDGTLKRIAALGYEEVETYGFDPQGLGYYGLPAKAFAQKLGDNKITTPSGHYDLNRLRVGQRGGTQALRRSLHRGRACARTVVHHLAAARPGFDRTIDKFKMLPSAEHHRRADQEGGA